MVASLVGDRQRNAGDEKAKQQLRALVREDKEREHKTHKAAYGHNVEQGHAVSLPASSITDKQIALKSQEGFETINEMPNIEHILCYSSQPYQNQVTLCVTFVSPS